MKKLAVPSLVLMVMLLFSSVFMALCKDGKPTVEPILKNKKVSIVVPVTIGAIEAFLEETKAQLESKGVEVYSFSAEGDATRFESVLKAALFKNPDILTIFGTQLTNTAFGPQFENNLPTVVASGISAPEKVDALLKVGIEPPRKAKVAIISDSPKQNIYARSATIISQLLAERNRVAGILYNESEINSKVTATSLRNSLELSGIKVHAGIVTGSYDVMNVAKSLILKGCKILIIPHDKYVLPKAGAIVKLSLEARPNEPIPVFSLDDGVVRDSGGALAVSVSYKDLGSMTARTCLDILTGKDPSQMPVQAQEFPSLFINYAAFQRMGLHLPESIMREATIIEREKSR